MTTDTAPTALTYSEAVDVLSRPADTSTDDDGMIAAIESGGDRVTGGPSPGAVAVAQEWRDAGLTADQARAYIEAGCWDADAVASLVAAGVTPDHLGDEDVLARVVIARGGDPGADDYEAVDYVTDGSLAYAHSNGDLSTDAIQRATVAARS